MTVQEIITRGLSHSTKNAPSRIVDDAIEGLAIVIEAVRGLFQLGTRINREWFGETLTVAGAAGAWARPADAESIYRLEIGSGARAGTKLTRVPFDDRATEFRKPSVYAFGRAYYPSGNALDPNPALESIKFFFASEPDLPADINAAIDARFPERFRELLALEFAVYLALKDERMAGELDHLKAERDRWLLRYVAFLEHEDTTEVRRHDHDRAFNGPSMVPLTSLVAGGTDLKLQ
jgi:hypothetical protein